MNTTSPIAAKAAAAKLHEEGFVLIGKRYFQARLLDLYEFQSAIRLRLADGTDMVTTREHFLKDKPLTTEQQAIIAKRLARQEQRKAFAEQVIGALPATTSALANLTGVWRSTVADRLRHWPEFEGLKRGGKERSEAGIGKWVKE